MDKLQFDAIKLADSMKYFCQEDKTFKLGEWRKWHNCCQAEGKILPPEDFKKKEK